VPPGLSCALTAGHGHRFAGLALYGAWAVLTSQPPPPVAAWPGAEAAAAAAAKAAGLPGLRALVGAWQLAAAAAAAALLDGAAGVRQPMTADMDGVRSVLLECVGACSQRQAA
jgi:hypothetical protein